MILFRSESYFLADFISIEDISVLYIRDLDFTNVQTKIEAKNLDFLSLMGFLSLNCHFLSFCCRFLFLIDLRVVLEQIFISIEGISVLYSDIQFIYC